MKTASRARIVEEVNQIIEQYPDMELTLRQIYYRLLSKHLFPNIHSSYQRLGKILVKARLNGDIPPGAIEDRTRKVEKGDVDLFTAVEYFNSHFDYFQKLDLHYKMPRWWGQPNKVVVMVEKDALSSLFREVTKEEGVDLVVCKGYPSFSVLYELAEKLNAEMKNIVILWFSDYDPSGKDIQRATIDRLRNDFGIEFSIERVALTKEQVRHYNLPPAPAKSSDPRYEVFVATEGDAWQVELDAVEPREMQRLVREAIRKHFDEDLKTKRDEELKHRQRRINKWVKKVISPNFDMPDDEDEHD